VYLVFRSPNRYRFSSAEGTTIHATSAQILPFDHTYFREFLNFMSKTMQSMASPGHSESHALARIICEKGRETVRTVQICLEGKPYVNRRRPITTSTPIILAHFNGCSGIADYLVIKNKYSPAMWRAGYCTALSKLESSILLSLLISPCIFSFSFHAKAKVISSAVQYT
jgi:hypothetical protein